MGGSNTANTGIGGDNLLDVIFSAGSSSVQAT